MDNEGLSLYQRYRPRKFDDVVGQDESVGMLKSAVATNNVRNAYLFHGNTGCGKTTNALILAAAVSCRNRKDGEYEPCGECEVCCDIFAGRESPALKIVDCAANSKVDFMREFLPQQAIKVSEKRRTIILDEVHALSSAAQATLYYGLEDQPSDNLVFILCTTNPEKLEQTVVNRSVPVGFPPIDHEALFGLVDRVLSDEGKRDQVQDSDIHAIVDMSNGSARYALTNTEAFLAGSGSSFKAFAVKSDFLDAIASRDIGKALFSAKRLASMNSFIPPLAEAAEMMTEIVIVHNGGQSDDPRAKSGAASWSPEQSLEAAHMFSSATTSIASLPRKYVVLLGTVSGALSPSLGGSSAMLAEEVRKLSEKVDAVASAPRTEPDSAPAAAVPQKETPRDGGDDEVWPSETPSAQDGNWPPSDGDDATDNGAGTAAGAEESGEAVSEPSVDLTQTFQMVRDNESALLYASAIAEAAKASGIDIDPRQVTIFPDFGGIRVAGGLSFPQRKEMHELLKRVVSPNVQVDFPQ